MLGDLMLLFDKLFHARRVYFNLLYVQLFLTTDNAVISLCVSAVHIYCCTLERTPTQVSWAVSKCAWLKYSRTRSSPYSSPLYLASTTPLETARNVLPGLTATTEESGTECENNPSGRAVASSWRIFDMSRR